MSTTIPFPAKQISGAEHKQRLDLPGPRVWKPKHLAEFLGFSVHWVYKRTASDAEDPIPRIPGAGQLRFDTWSPAFQQWIARQLGCVDIGVSDE
jgi:hypothetical protein